MQIWCSQQSWGRAAVAPLDLTIHAEWIAHGAIRHLAQRWVLKPHQMGSHTKTPACTHTYAHTHARIHARTRKQTHKSANMLAHVHTHLHENEMTFSPLHKAPVDNSLRFLLRCSASVGGVTLDNAIRSQRRQNANLFIT